MKHLVIGLGEVGRAIKGIFNCPGIDTNTQIAQDPSSDFAFDVMHVCFPYSETFQQSVNDYKERFQPKYIVVHSTVPIGTCEELKVNHSPIRGKHPHLFESVKTFKKFIGGPNSVTLGEEFQKYGVAAFCVSLARDTEAMKLWDTTQYGVMIMLEKEIHEFCQKNNLDFDTVYTQANITYNKGYEKMGLLNVRRPVLQHMDGVIGGHCVVENCKLLDSKIAKEILEKNPK